ncbi:MAG: hypothetical protein ACM338_15145, partial [Betaproteobacteria bacterium]
GLRGGRQCQRERDGGEREAQARGQASHCGSPVGDVRRRRREMQVTGGLEDVSRDRASGIRDRGSGIGHQASGIRDQASEIRQQAAGRFSQLRGFYNGLQSADDLRRRRPASIGAARFLIPDTRYLIPDT